jgi:hypothetical protein
VIDSIGRCSFVTQRDSEMACLFRVQGVCTSRPPRIHRTATWLGSVVMPLATIHPSAHGLAIADPNSCVTAEPDSAGSNDMLFLEVHGDFIRQLLEQEKFKELNCIADSERSSKERLPGGMWKIHEFYWRSTTCRAISLSKTGKII